MKQRISTSLLLALPLVAAGVHADDSQPADMSDPMAVYTQGGFSAGTNGVNLKMGKSLDTGSKDQMGMILLEAKGLMGEMTDDYGKTKSNPASADNSMDSLRFRYFGVDMSNGRGKYVDVSHSMDADMGMASFGLMQALPKMGNFQMFPILAAGVQYSNGDLNDDLVDGGMTDADDVSSGINSVYGQLVLYTKYTINDKIWLNYNPSYTHAFAGDDYWVDTLRGSEGVAHEFIASYQMSPTDNLRLFYNASQNDFAEGDWRLEYNHQF